MKCPVCNTTIVNGVCPSCGMRIRTARQEPVKYDTSIKSTGECKSEPKNYESEKSLHKFIKETDSENSQGVYSTPGAKQWLLEQRKKRIGYVVFAVIFLAFGVFFIKDLVWDYHDFRNTQGDYEGVQSKVTEFENVEEIAEYWDDYSDGDRITVAGAGYTYNGSVGVFCQDNSSKRFIYKGTLNRMIDNRYYYNKHDDVYFDSNYNAVSSVPENYIELS